MNSIFNIFIETDIARINCGEFDLNPNIFYRPYINEFPIHVYFKKETNKWIYEIINEEQFKVYAHSIVLAEIKTTVPNKVLDIKDDALVIKIDIQRAL